MRALVLSLLLAGVADGAARAAPHSEGRIAVERARRRNLRESGRGREVLRTALRFILVAMPARAPGR